MKTPHHHPYRHAVILTAVLTVGAAVVAPVGSRLQAADTYYVATTGNDANDGRSIKAPFRHIQRAADTMKPGDTCIIRGGEYREKIVPPRGGTSDKVRITYQSHPGETAIIKGSERITGWTDQGGGVWKAVIPRDRFSSSAYNPFQTKLSGHCIINPGNQWSLGMVYLDGRPLSECQTREEVAVIPGGWFAAVEGSETVVIARFDADPNAKLAEVNVRDSCFHPGDKVLHYITIQGLTLKQAAPNGSGPVFPQQGIITAYAGRGWTIEDCVVSDSASSGIALATGPESWYNNDAGTVKRRAADPNFEKSGSHVVRGNTIERCGQAGIIGMINGHSSLIERNLIQDINWQQKVGGVETAGIKLHWAIDTVISHNIVRRVYRETSSGQVHGIYLDFGHQGSRITGNVVYDIIDPQKSSPKAFSIYLEANVGPVIVDNNIVIKHPTQPWNNELSSQFQVAAHNLMLDGRLQQFNDPARDVPYYEPNSLRFIAKMDATTASNQQYNRYINRNNIYIGQFSGQGGATEVGGNVDWTWGDAQSKLAFTWTDKATGIDISFVVPEEAAARLTGSDLVTAASVGEFPLVKQGMCDRDGKPYDLDTDILGKPRSKAAGSVVPGPFASLARGKKDENAFSFTAGRSSDLIVPLPTVIMKSEAAMSANGASVDVAVGGTSITARGVCWSSKPNPTVADTKTTDGLGSGPFKGSLTGLKTGNVYHVRAYATNAAGTTYGRSIMVIP